MKHNQIVTLDKLRDCAARGLTQREARQEIGCAQSTLSRWSAANGIAFAPELTRGNKSFLTGGILRDCIKRKMTIKEIMKENRCSNAAVHRVANENGIKLPTAGGKRPQGKPVKEMRAPKPEKPRKPLPSPADCKDGAALYSLMWEFAARENAAMRKICVNK